MHMLHQLSAPHSLARTYEHVARAALTLAHTWTEHPEHSPPTPEWQWLSGLNALRARQREGTQALSSPVIPDTEAHHPAHGVHLRAQHPKARLSVQSDPAAHEISCRHMTEALRSRRALASEYYAKGPAASPEPRHVESAGQSHTPHALRAHPMPTAVAQRPGRPCLRRHTNDSLQSNA